MTSEKPPPDALRGSGGSSALSLSKQQEPRASDYCNRNFCPDTNERRRLLHSFEQQLHRSNSSLEFTSENEQQIRRRSLEDYGNLHREYGSHGSIDILNGSGPQRTGESFFAMLKDYQPVGLGANGTDQRSPAPIDYLRAKNIEGFVDILSPSNCASESQICMVWPDAISGSLLGKHRGSQASAISISPKLKHKFQRFWGGGSQFLNNDVNNANSGSCKMSSNMNSRSDRLSNASDDGVKNSGSSSIVVISSSPDMEERQRRRAFAHYDCQSLTVNLGYAAKLRGLLLARRRNTTTGASAASTVSSDSYSMSSRVPDTDEESPDGPCNQLVPTCPYFRNEIGGEQEREVSLSRLPVRDGPHLPAMACGVSILEPQTGSSLWVGTTCPYQKQSRPIEARDSGALYYRQYFYNREHQNWFGLDEQLGPVGVSICRERVDSGESNAPALYRVVVRTSELLTLRGSVFEDALPGSSATKGTKEVIEYVAPELQLSCLRLGISTRQCEEQLLKLDEQGLTSCYKVGIMYCKAGQSSEEEMYNNQHSGPAFDEFLHIIGKRVRLKGFDKYRAGLDNKTDSTGTHSVYAVYSDCEVMFHVSTLLPFTPNNRQQLLRKRHIGNDIVTIVFQEPDALPFTPKHIRSQFQHVFIVVRAINPCSEDTHYALAVSRSKEVPIFGPPIKEGGIYPKGKSFVEFLLAKAINAENAAHRSEKFSTMATRTRQEYLKDLANNYSTTTLVDMGQKFSLFSSIFLSRPSVARTTYVPCARQRGAICWQVLLQDPSRPCPVDCLLGISSDTFVLVEEGTRRIIFVTPCKAILGWWTTNQSSGLRVYHHQGECVTLCMRGADDRSDEQTEIMARLRVVTDGHLAQELVLRRNGAGQLGFHVQPDGVVTQVEVNGSAWSAGLRQGARLVEICKVAVATLTHDQMVDLLKTSVLVTVTVIPPHIDGSFRRGCALQNCKYISAYMDTDYDNIMITSTSTLLNTDDITKSTHNKGAQMQLKSNHRQKYERSFSPPRSSNSSGYGTGSSSKSFNNDPRFSSIWYEILEPSEQVISVCKSGTSEIGTTSYQGSPKHCKSQTSDFPSLLQFVPAFLDTSDLKNSQSVDETIVKKNGNETGLTANIATIEHIQTIKNDIQCTKNETTPNDRLLIASTPNSPCLRRSSKLRTTLILKNGKHTTSSIPEIRSRNSVTSRCVNRHSANLSSTLQEDLMRLINPDYIPDEGVSSQRKQGCSSMINISTITDSKNKHLAEKSEDRNPQSLLNLSIKDNEISSQKSIAEVIFTMARPATVISNTSTTSSPNPYEMKMSKEERLSPRATVIAKKSSSAGQINSLKSLTVNTSSACDDRELDWPGLVDKANRAMLQVRVDTDGFNMNDDCRVTEATSFQCWDNGNILTHSASVPELKNHLNQLECRVVRETQQRLTLEDEVRRLKEENRRLQDESEIAAQQLQKYTEWFFQTIHRQ